MIPLRDPIFTWNRIIEKNKKDYFLLTTTSNGDLSYNIIFSPLETCGKHSLFKTDNMKKSINLRKTCNDIGVHNCFHLPENEGFYAVFENTFEIAKEMTCGVKVIHSVVKLQVVAFMMDFQFKVEGKEQTCSPTVLLSDG